MRTSAIKYIFIFQQASKGSQRWGAKKTKMNPQVWEICNRFGEGKQNQKPFYVQVKEVQWETQSAGESIRLAQPPLSFPHPEQPAFVCSPAALLPEDEWMEVFDVHTSKISKGPEILPT